MSRPEQIENPYRAPADASTELPELVNPKIKRIRKNGCLMMVIPPIVGVFVFWFGEYLMSRTGMMGTNPGIVLVVWIVACFFSLFILPSLGLVRLIFPRLYLKKRRVPTEDSFDE